MYGPPPSDSESEDGFEMFLSSKDKPKPVYQPSHKDQINNNLYEAVEIGNLDKLRDLLKEYLQYYTIDTPLRHGWSVLQYACYSGHVSIVEYLLDLSADVNRQIDSFTPLLLACDCRKPEAATAIVNILLKYGAFINVADRNGLTPMMLAIKNGFNEIAETILKQVSLEAEDMQGKKLMFIHGTQRYWRIIN